jgi:hypothetical protein
MLRPLNHDYHFPLEVVLSGPLKQILSFVYGHDGKLAPNLVLGSDFEHPCHILHTRVQPSFDNDFVEGEVDSIEMKPFLSQPQHHRGSASNRYPPRCPYKRPRHGDQCHR